MLGWVEAVTTTVVGVLLGGAVSWWASRAQRRSDTAARRIERSIGAATAVLRDFLALDQTVTLRRHSPVSQEDLATQFNTFTLTSEAEGAAITDPEVRSRVDAHRLLLGTILDTAIRMGWTFLPGDMLDVVGRHSSLVQETLQCYIRQEALPAYEAPPLGDAKALIAWGQPGLSSALFSPDDQQA